MLGRLNNAEIEKVLESQVIGRIGCHGNDTTYIVPISYAYDGKYIYAHTQTGMKTDIMRKNPNVCFEVETFENMANWKSVILWGLYEEIKDTELRRDALAKLLNRQVPLVPSKTMKLTPNWPFGPSDLNSIGGIVFRIEVQKRSGRFETSEAYSSSAVNHH